MYKDRNETIEWPEEAVETLQLRVDRLTIGIRSKEKKMGANHLNFVFLALTLTCFVLLFANGERIRKSIYVPITRGGHFCFRKANGTHQFGCSSQLNGNVGVVHFIKSKNDLEFVKSQGKAAPYIGNDKNFRITI